MLAAATDTSGEELTSLSHQKALATSFLELLKTEKLENKTREFWIILSFLITGQSGSGQGALSDKVTAVPHSPNCHSHAQLMLSLA